MAVMNTKLGTKPGVMPTDTIQKSSGVNTISAGDKHFEGQDMGTVLNKIADPNYVDTSKKIRAVGSDKMDKDAFMKLMLAQMKNQDPTNPLKSHEMAAQLAQFTSVEQMQNMNNTLTEMRNGQKPAENFQALNFIGKSVSGDSAKLTRLKGDKSHEISFNLPDTAQKLSIKIRNADGDIVRKIDLNNLKAGENSYSWNGQNEQGVNAPTGDYQTIIEAVGSNGRKLAVKTDFDGLITGVNYTSEGPVLLVGTQTIKLKDVKKIVDPSLMKNGQISKNQPGRDLNKQGDIRETNNKATEGAEDAPMKSSMMDNVGMTRDMMMKLAKETKSDEDVRNSRPNQPATPGAVEEQPSEVTN
jgi:flagellar basal-body rod modification protein FlgD